MKSLKKAEPSQDRKQSNTRTKRNGAVICARTCHCAKGKSKSGAHKRVKKSGGEVEKEVPIVSFDDMAPESEDQKSEKIESLPILVGVDRTHEGLRTCYRRKATTRTQSG